MNFKDIPNYEGHYAASTCGKIWSHKAKKILKTNTNADGYERLNLCKNGIQINWRVHKLVLLTFIGESKLEINHKNAIKTDNRLCNLEYVTHKQNMKHASLNKVFKDRKGTKNSRCKLTEKQVLEIRKSKLNKSQLSRKYNVGRTTVYHILNRTSWVHI